MTKKVGIFCRLNAARSPLLEALLSRHYSNYSFFSGGVLANEGVGLPTISKVFSNSLGLSDLKQHSNNVRDQANSILDADVLLGADDFTCQLLEQMYPEKNILSIESRAREVGIALVDPVNLVDYEFNHFLGKFLYFGFSVFRELENQGNQFPISALIANQENIYGELKILLESQCVDGHQPLIVDCNLKFATKSQYLGLVPENQQFELPAKSMIALNEWAVNSISLIRPSHEVTSWESFITGLEWSHWLIELSRSRPIILLCTPIDIIEGVKHNSFIEALHADRMVYRP